MRLTLLSSALAVRYGTARQRACHALRLALGRFGAVDHVIVDAWNTEWPARRLLRRGDRFFAHAQGDLAASAGGFLAAAHHGRLRDIAPPRDDGGDGCAAWLNPRRQARIAAHLARQAPDLVVVADPVLADLGRAVTPAGTGFGVIDDGTAAWADRMAVMMRNPAEHGWMARLARMARPGADSQPIAPGLEYERSDLFFAKLPGIVIPATGVAWLDRHSLSVASAICAMLDQPGDDADGVRVTLMGFDPAQARSHCPTAEIQTGWTRLHTQIGTAQALVMPWLTPALAALIPAALAAGTPVFLRHSDRQGFDIPAQDGVFAYLENHLAAAVANALRCDLATPDYCRAVAAQSVADPAPEALAGPLAQAMAAWTGRPPAPLVADPALPDPRWQPISAAPTVLYNPVTRMLLVQAGLKGWGHVEELRLIDAHGRELTRLAPDARQRAARDYLLEGGVVTDLAPLGGAITIEGWRDRERLFTHHIPCDDFAQVEAGIVSMDHGEATITGTFWARRADAPARWSVRVTEQPALAAQPSGCTAPDLGVDLWHYRVPVPTARHRHVTLDLLRDDARTHRPAPPPQIVYATPRAVVASRAPNPAVAAFRDIHAGRRAWVVGNGPSVRLDDLARIPKDDIVFCFNRFYLSYDTNPLRETYVVSADTLMIRDFGQEMIDRSAGFALFCIPPEHVKGLEGAFLRLQPGASTVPDFSFNPDRYVSVGGSSVFIALQMAWFMGLRDVVLYGMDYSFTTTLVRDPRYPFPVAFDEGNHFIQSYRSAKPWCPPTWRDISAGFLNARLAYDMTGGRIVNATRGGRLETFQRVDFDTLLAQGPHPHGTQDHQDQTC